VIRRWREIERWIEDGESVHAGVFPERPLRDFITRKIIPIDREERPLNQLNVIAKITFGGKLHVRSEEAKRGYKGPLFQADPSDLVISKIRVAQGSLCVVPDTLDHLAVSAEYPVYAVDNSTVHTEYLRLVIRSSAFQARVARLRSGNTTKARIRPAQFEALKFPLPTLDEQDALIASYAAALHRAEKLEQDADAIEQAGWQNRVGGGVTPAVLPHHRAYGSVHGGS
jgi:type I restriction enzyme S subunit